MDAITAILVNAKEAGRFVFEAASTEIEGKTAWWFNSEQAKELPGAYSAVLYQYPNGSYASNTFSNYPELVGRIQQYVLDGKF